MRGRRGRLARSVARAVSARARRRAARVGAAQTASARHPAPAASARRRHAAHATRSARRDRRRTRTGGAAATEPIDDDVDRVLTRTIVQASRQATTTVLTVADSADVPQLGRARLARCRRRRSSVLRGQRLVARSCADGRLGAERERRQRRRRAARRRRCDGRDAGGASRTPVAVGETLDARDAAPLGAGRSAPAAAPGPRDVPARLAGARRRRRVRLDARRRSPSDAERDGGVADVGARMTGTMQIDRGAAGSPTRASPCVIRSDRHAAERQRDAADAVRTKITQRLRRWTSGDPPLDLQCGASEPTSRAQPLGAPRLLATSTPSSAPRPPRRPPPRLPPVSAADSARHQPARGGRRAVVHARDRQDHRARARRRAHRRRRVPHGPADEPGDPARVLAVRAAARGAARQRSW